MAHVVENFAAAVLPFAFAGTADAALFPYTGETSLDVTELYAGATPRFVETVRGVGYRLAAAD